MDWVPLTVCDMDSGPSTDNNQFGDSGPFHQKVFSKHENGRSEMVRHCGRVLHEGMVGHGRLVIIAGAGWNMGGGLKRGRGQA